MDACHVLVKQITFRNAAFCCNQRSLRAPGTWSGQVLIAFQHVSSGLVSYRDGEQKPVASCRGCCVAKSSGLKLRFKFATVDGLAKFKIVHDCAPRLREVKLSSDMGDLLEPYNKLDVDAEAV